MVIKKNKLHYVSATLQTEWMTSKQQKQLPLKKKKYELKTKQRKNTARTEASNE